jgi:branched-chain amino acid transport system substrate-binding protein
VIAIGRPSPSSGSTATKVGTGTALPTSKCADSGNGKKATGAPIKLGGIAMLIPGVDFTTIGNGREGYLRLRQRQRRHPRPPDPIHALHGAAQPGAGGRARAEADPERQGRRHRRQHELRRVRDELEYYKSKGFVVIGAGVQAECYSTPSFAETTWARATATSAPRRRSIRAGIKKLAIASPEAISGLRDGGAALVAKAAGIPVKIYPTHLPVTDAASQLLQMYQFAGEGGGILLDFTPDTAPAFMKAAIAQGIVDKVKWGSSTPIANTFMAAQFPQFDGHLWINQEFSNVDPSVGPDTALMFNILKKYAPKIAPQAFSQMGFMDGKFSTNALLSIKGPITAASYNRAVRALKNQKTDMLCKPFYVGTLPFHIPNNTDITVDYKAGKVVVKEKCFAIAPVDKALAQTRAFEKKLKLNTG